MPLNTIEAITTRYSCRDFLDRMPSDDDLQTITDAAIASPSAMNRQPWQIILVKDRALIDTLDKAGMEGLAALPDRSTFERIQSRGGKLFYNAPCMIVIALDTATPSGYEHIDCGIATQNIALAATSLGINSLICGLFKFAFTDEDTADEFKRRLNFHDAFEVGIAVLLGYGTHAGRKDPHDLDRSKITRV